MRCSTRVHSHYLHFNPETAGLASERFGQRFSRSLTCRISRDRTSTPLRVEKRLRRVVPSGRVPQRRGPRLGLRRLSAAQENAMTDAIEAWTRRTGVNPSGILFDDAKDMVVRALPIDGVQVIAWLTGGTCGGCG